MKMEMKNDKGHHLTNYQLISSSDFNLRRGIENGEFSCELKCREHSRYSHQGQAIWQNINLFVKNLTPQFLPMNFIVNQNSYCVIQACIRIDVDQVLHIIQNIFKVIMSKCNMTVHFLTSPG